MAFLGLCCPVYAQKADVRKEVQATFDRIMAGYKKKDAKAIAANYTPDFVLKNPSGATETRAALEKQWAQNFSRIKSVDVATLTPGTVTQKGNMAMTDYKIRMDMSVADPQGNKHVASMMGEGKATLIKKGSTWLMYRQVVSAQPKMTMDGRQMGPPPKKP